MYHGNAVGVVVPAYNEERFVGTVIDTIPEFVDRTYVVDDHSSDDTWRVIRTHASRVNARTTESTTEDELSLLTADGGETLHQRVVTIRHPTNRGRGAAVKTGYRQALEDGMDIVVVMDADGQMDPDILPSIIDPVAQGTADYAVGDRLAGPTYWRGMPPWRLFGNGLLSGLTRVASGYWHIRDPQNGYTAISAETLSNLDFDRLYDRYGFLNDLLVHLNVAETRVATVPMYARYGDEESGIRYSSFVPGLSFLLLKGFLWRLHVKYLSSGPHPLVGMYVLGVLGILAGIVRLGRRLLGQPHAAGSGTRVLAGILSLVGAVLLDNREGEHLQRAVSTMDVLANPRETTADEQVLEGENHETDSQDDDPLEQIQ
ncbi:MULTISPECIES: glycosyltransferase family 2 protein [Haloferax]|uniref:Glycosyltransferase n=2 Tax=Haloferax TaxID=2251 RepID=A0A6G1Z795_9EURY|nr:MULTISPECIES: glycosyltransferase family 2 protein [Haloferax]KAB1185111.1 glycosyltransferase [Haloferax sp. CBA1149]MRW82288.1 glycosyltransferase [Haloferax marinisediminis]